MHLEPLMRDWIDEPAARSSGGYQSRLRSLWQREKDFSGDPRTLDRSRVEAVTAFGHAVLERLDTGGPEAGLAPVARSLLASIGLLGSGERLASDAPILAGVAAFGRGLTPSTRAPLAQESLTLNQLGMLKDLLNRTVFNGPRITLLAPITPATEALTRLLPRELT